MTIDATKPIDKAAVEHKDISKSAQSEACKTSSTPGSDKKVPSDLKEQPLKVEAKADSFQAKKN